MTAVNRYVDPTTRDYVIQAGAPREDATLASTVAFLLNLEQGSCVLDPELGSRLHTIRHARRDAKVLGESYARLAVRPLVEAGKLPGLEVTARVYESARREKHLEVIVTWTRDGRRVAPVRYSRRLG